MDPQGRDVVPASLLVPPGVSDKAAHQADLRAMKISQQIAAAVALRHLGYKVVARPSGVVVDEIETTSHAVGVLQPADVITAVDGTPTPTIASLRATLDRVQPGRTVTLRIRRGAAETITRQGEDDRRPGRTGARDHRLHAGPGGGHPPAAQGRRSTPATSAARRPGSRSRSRCWPSSATTVDHGYKVAATGQIELDGTVAPIGGVKQKTFGVRDAGADVFLVPVAGDNAREARALRGGAEDHPCEDVSQALRALAKLPPKR